MKFELSLFILLMLTWVALSGESKVLLISLGVFSSALVTFIVHRMNYRDGDWHPLDVHWIKLAGYTLWLGKEMLMSNIQVARAILLEPDSIHPRRFRVGTASLSELGQVIYANSITLTPGTVSLFLRDGEIEVHALLEEAAESLEGGEMRKRVQAVCKETQT